MSQVPATSPETIVRPAPALLSLVLPIYNEEEVITLLRARLEAMSARLKMKTEFILVNDGSSDQSLPQLLAWSKADPRAIVIDFSRNFGHQAAVTAGLDYSQGDAVVIMDADLQDPPELVEKMLERYQQGYDVVYARRVSRQGETFFKKVTAALFYRIMQKFVHKDLPADTGDFRLVSRDVVNAIGGVRESHRFLRGLFTWVGFRQIAVEYDRAARPAGVTKYPLRKMLHFAWDAIVSFSSLPLRLSAYVGAMISLLGLAYGIYSVVRKFVYQDT
ncbi:MAG: glycosyltransferase family 2 protein, partial [Bdellovibrionota bacterium]